MVDVNFAECMFQSIYISSWEPSSVKTNAPPLLWKHPKPAASQLQVPRSSSYRQPPAGCMQTAPALNSPLPPIPPFLAPFRPFWPPSAASEQTVWSAMCIYVYMYTYIHIYKYTYVCYIWRLISRTSRSRKKL